jgi:predicted MFS family arabinose efflux permease
MDWRSSPQCTKLMLSVDDFSNSLLSLFVTWQDLGAVTGPLLGYWIAPQVGLFWLYLMGASLLLVAAVIYLVTFRQYTPQAFAARVRSRS